MDDSVAPNLTFDPVAFSKKFRQLRERIADVIVGQDTLIEDVLITVLAGGHALIEGAPGLGKTRLVRSFAALTDLEFSRLQFTPDLMPADITGTSVIQEGEGVKLEFERGPIFCHVLLADEINRASPKTQSALLEAMQEGTVTVAGVRHPLPQPFITLATQNPFEMEGTYPLPEAQLDRFLLKLHIQRPDAESLKHILSLTTGNAEADLRPVFRQQELQQLQRMLRDVPVASKALDAVVALVEATHHHKAVRLGASPRGAQAIILAAKGYALAAGRPNVEFVDIERAIIPALRHRLIRTYIDRGNVSTDTIIQELWQQVMKEQ